MMGSLLRLTRADFGYRPERLLMLVGGRTRRPSRVTAATAPAHREADRASRRRSRRRVDRRRSPTAFRRREGGLGPLVRRRKPGATASCRRRRWTPSRGSPMTYFAPPPESFERNPSINWEAISGNYFDTMGIPLLSGRTFTDGTPRTPRAWSSWGRASPKGSGPARIPSASGSSRYGHRYDRGSPRGVADGRRPRRRCALSGDRGLPARRVRSRIFSRRWYRAPWS